MAKGERLESRARNRALQALYAWDVRAAEGLELVATRVWDDLAVGPEERRIAGFIVGEVIRHGEEIDRELGEVTTNWRLERLGAIERRKS
jgi:N utilization substance protein B